MAKRIYTLKGPVELDALGLILPHEHLFTDLRGPSVADYAQGNPEAVLQVVGPHLADALAAGVTAMVECSTVGVGRNLEILQRQAEATSIRIVAPTGSCFHTMRVGSSPGARTGCLNQAIGVTQRQHVTSSLPCSSAGSAKNKYSRSP